MPRHRFLQSTGISVLASKARGMLHPGHVVWNEILVASHARRPGQQNITRPFRRDRSRLDARRCSPRGQFEPPSLSISFLFDFLLSISFVDTVPDNPYAVRRLSFGLAVSLGALRGGSVCRQPSTHSRASVSLFCRASF